MDYMIAPLQMHSACKDLFEAVGGFGVCSVYIWSSRGILSSSVVIGSIFELQARATAFSVDRLITILVLFVAEYQGVHVVCMRGTHLFQGVSASTSYIEAQFAVIF